MSAENTSQMAPAFDPRPVETKWSQIWLDEKLGQPTPATSHDAKSGARPFVVTIPPPNVTGVLHLGHALQHAIHDCLARFHRMKGEPTLVVPGTDHAGIATQVKVETLLRSQGISREELGRDEFINRVYDWKNQYGATIIEQMHALGCSYDWERERFTMDEAYVRAVLTVFKSWFERGLIYRGTRLGNWSSGAQTMISDQEIDDKETKGTLTYIKYPVENAPGEFVTVATTRPETMMGDSAVAVHPDDARYAHLRGKNVVLPLVNRAIPVIFDDYVASEFGTGALKVTPAHDQNDYELGQRHGLQQITVIGFNDEITDNGGDYAGLKTAEARVRVVEDLRALGLIEKIEPITHSVPHCSRTGVVIEPLLSEQWFVAMKELARPVADAIRMNRVSYRPARFADTSVDWLDNIRDWCISRQLWWGHRIPIYYGPNGETVCSLEPIEGAGWTQDEDVLDTWFSSALWPFAVLGWPDELERQWYPTSVLITGRDILHLWVSRMIATSLDYVQTDAGQPEIPFHQVYVHPTIQDTFGRRMSKSSGTGIDPLELIETYGADATRYGLLQLAGGAQDTRFLDGAMTKLGERFVRDWTETHRADPQPLPLEWNDADGKATERYPQMQSARNFANKIWNAARFVLSFEPTEYSGEVPDDLASRWIESRLNATIIEITRALDNYEFESAASTLYAFIWNDLCDWFLEVSKPKLREGDSSHAAFLAHVFETSLRLLHPFMPFLSEEIWAQLPGNSMIWVSAQTKNGGEMRQVPSEEISLLARADWPIAGGVAANDEREFALIQETIRATRNLRGGADIAPGKRLNVTFIALNDEAARTLNEGIGYLTEMARLETATIVDNGASRADNALSATLPEVEIWLPLEGLIDVEKERAKLEKQLETARKELAKVTAKLGNVGFTAKAPAEVVAKEEAKRAELAATIENAQTRLAAL